MVIEARAVPCMDCGQVVPAHVMDFDHRDGKESEISVLVNTLSVRRLVAEMAKCDVVSANCHRIRTYGQPTRHVTGPPRPTSRPRESPVAPGLWATDDAEPDDG